MRSENQTINDPKTHIIVFWQADWHIDRKEETTAEE